MHERPTMMLRAPLFVLALAIGGAVACGSPEPAEEAVAPASATGAEPVKYGLENTLTWVTSEEIANTGYIVYRGETSRGPWYRLTPEPLPGGGTTSETKTYSFVDDTRSSRTRPTSTSCARCRKKGSRRW